MPILDCYPIRVRWCQRASTDSWVCSSIGTCPHLGNMALSQDIRWWWGMRVVLFSDIWWSPPDPGIFHTTLPWYLPSWSQCICWSVLAQLHSYDSHWCWCRVLAMPLQNRLLIWAANAWFWAPDQAKWRSRSCVNLPIQDRLPSLCKLIQAMPLYSGRAPSSCLNNQSFLQSCRWLDRPWIKTRSSHTTSSLSDRGHVTNHALMIGEPAVATTDCAPDRKHSTWTPKLARCLFWKLFGRSWVWWLMRCPVLRSPLRISDDVRQAEHMRISDSYHAILRSLVWRLWESLFLAQELASLGKRVIAWGAALRSCCRHLWIWHVVWCGQCSAVEGDEA